MGEGEGELGKREGRGGGWRKKEGREKRIGKKGSARIGERKECRTRS